jgi:energy-coupling factor transporter ATP-binding protein EcfA2
MGAVMSAATDRARANAERMRDEQAGGQPRRTGRTWRECCAEIYARANEPWVDIKIANTTIATCRNGSLITLTAPSGSGKSTLALQMLVAHAVKHGPAVYKTHELDGDEAVARAIGQLCGYSWADTLKGCVPPDMIPEVDRLRVLERDQATTENLEKAIAELRQEYPDQPILVVDDYLQATPAPPGGERGFVAGVVTELRRAAKRLRVVIIGVSQASTGNAKAMREGILIGIDSASTGAETSQIERDSYLILTLGARRIVDPATVAWSLSVAKQRMGEADMVFEAHYRGRVGDWSIVGEPRMASEVRETRSTDDKAKAIDTIKGAIRDLVSKSEAPMSRKAISDRVKGTNALITDAIKELVRDGELVPIMSARKVGGHHPLWTPEKAAQMGATP